MTDMAELVSIIVQAVPIATGAMRTGYVFNELRFSFHHDASFHSPMLAKAYPM